MADAGLPNPEVTGDGTVYTLFDDDGSLYYVVYGSQEAGQRWRVNKTDEGKVYYVNSKTKASAWKLPDVPSSDRPVDIPTLPLSIAVRAFYTHYNKDKVPKSLHVVTQYLTKQDQLFPDLYRTYNQEAYPLEADLFLFYAEHSKDKIQNVPQIAKEWKDRKAELWKTLKQRYGVVDDAREEPEEEDEETEESSEDIPISHEHKRRLVDFYKKAAPEKISEIDTILRHYHGKEDELMAMLVQRYPQHTDILRPELLQTSPASPASVPRAEPEVEKKPPTPLRSPQTEAEEAPTPPPRANQKHQREADDLKAENARLEAELLKMKELLEVKEEPQGDSVLLGKSLGLAKSRLKDSRTAVDVAQQMVLATQKDADRAHVELQRSREREKDLLNGMAALRKNAKEAELLLNERVLALEKQVVTLRATGSAAATSANDTLFRLQQDLSLARYADLPRGHPMLTEIETQTAEVNTAVGSNRGVTTTPSLGAAHAPVPPPSLGLCDEGVQCNVPTASKGVQARVREQEAEADELPQSPTQFLWSERKPPQLHLKAAATVDVMTQTTVDIFPQLEDALDKVQACTSIRFKLREELNGLEEVVEAQCGQITHLRGFRRAYLKVRVPEVAAAAVLTLAAAQSAVTRPQPAPKPKHSNVTPADAQFLMEELERLRFLDKRVHSRSKSPGGQRPPDYKRVAMEYIRGKK